MAWRPPDVQLTACARWAGGNRRTSTAAPTALPTSTTILREVALRGSAAGCVAVEVTAAYCRTSPAGGPETLLKKLETPQKRNTGQTDWR